MKRSTARALAILAVLAMVIAACSAPGGDEETTTSAAETGDTEAPADTTTTAPETTESTEAPDDMEPIRIGLLQPLTGGLAASGGDAQAGFELYWETNGLESGGRTIEYRVEDTAGMCADDRIPEAGRFRQRRRARERLIKHASISNE